MTIASKALHGRNDIAPFITRLLALGLLTLAATACPGPDPNTEPETTTDGSTTYTTFPDECATGGGSDYCCQFNSNFCDTDTNTTLEDECEPPHTENFVAVVGISEGVTTWSTIVEGEMTIGGVPAVPDLEGGVVFASLLVDQGSQLARHAADGTRVATLPLSGAPHDLATDGSGRFVYTGIFENGEIFEAAYGEVDQGLMPLGPERALPWELASLHEYHLGIAAAPDGTTFAAGGDARGAGRWISKLDADGNEVWTSPWPVESEPDEFANGRVAGVAVLANGTVGMVLTSGNLYSGNLWLEAFQPDGTHAWAATTPSRKTLGVVADVDTFVVSSNDWVDATMADGAQAWSVAVDVRGLGKPCTDTELVAATPTGFARFAPGGAAVVQEVDLLALELPIEGAGEKGALVHDVVCTPNGDVILVADIDVYTPGDCATGG